LASPDAHGIRVVCLGLVMLVVAPDCPAAPGEASRPQTNAAGAAIRWQDAAFETARQTWLAAPTNFIAAWQFGRACFDRADLATNNAERAAVAELGIAACRDALAFDTNSAPVHYYLGMNLGQLAQTRALGALKLVREMEAEFKAARLLDERFDFAGPDRNLGLLYLQAPGWPTSLGSRAKARHHLRRAVDLSPEYPENPLNWLEACLRWKDWQEAARALARLESVWPEARTKFTGAQWAAAWADWEARRARASKAVADRP